MAEWDRATRSMLDGVHIIERIHKRGSLLKVLDQPHLDLTTPIGRGFIAFLSALAEDERGRIVSAPTTAALLPRLAAPSSVESRNSMLTSSARH